MIRLMMAAAAVAFVALPAQATTFTTAQLASASDGLQALRELNLTVLGNLTSSSEVEGKAFVGGNVTGSSENFGFGSSAHPNEGFRQNNARAVLTVGGTLGISATLSNGNTVNSATGTTMQVSGNGAQSLTDSRFDVGRDSTGQIADNIASSLVRTGGSFNNQNFNPNSGKAAQYGTTASNVQAQDTPYVTQNAALAPGGSSDLAASIASQTNTLRTNLSTLSDVLANLATNAVLNVSDRNQIHFDYSTAANSANFVVATISADSLFGASGNAQGGTLLLNLLATGTGYKTTIINVTGAGAYRDIINNNDNQGSNDQNIIWNFVNTVASGSSLAVDANFHGSILAPNETIGNSTQINGSVAAGMFSQAGEIHLGTFNGVSAIVANNPVSSVPEPASWATMLAGFAAIGALMRRKERSLPYTA